MSLVDVVDKSKQLDALTRNYFDNDPNYSGVDVVKLTET